MRHLALILAAFFACLVLPAQAATLSATPDDLRVKWAAVQPGDTFKPVGVFPDLQLAGRSFDRRVTFDASQATFGRVYIVGQRGLTVKGGRWISLRFDGFDGVSVVDAAFEGPEPRNDMGLRFLYGKNAYSARNSFKSLLNGVAVEGVTGAEVISTTCVDMRGDCMNIPDSHKVTVDGVVVRDSRMGTGDEHQDAIQGWSIKGKPPMSDIVIRNVLSVGRQGGVNFYNSADGGIDRLTVEDVTVIGGFAHGLTVGNGRDVRLRRIFLGTYPGVRDQVRVMIDRPEGVVERCGIVVSAYGGSPAVVEPACK